MAMGKVYEAAKISAVAEEREKAYENLANQLSTLKAALQAVANLGGSLEGKGADNIKAFYQYQVDNAQQWENLVKAAKSYFSALYVKAEEAKLSGHTFVDVSFLENEIKQSITQSKQMVSQQQEDLQTIFNEIDDIVPLSVFSKEKYDDYIESSDEKREKTINAVEKIDQDWLESYDQMDAFYQVVKARVAGLDAATRQGGNVYPMKFDQQAYQSSELYKVQKEMNEYATAYVDYNNQAEEVHELKKEAEQRAIEGANKPWYEKTWDTVSTFTGEVTGYYDYKRASEGIDPVTGEKLSTSQRVAAGAMAAAGFIPVVGWAGRAAKGGKAIYSTAKGINAADHALDAYKTSKSFKALEQAEKGLYGLVAANGLYEYTTGKDMFGNEISEQQRNSSLFQAFGIAGAGALSSKYAAKTVQAGANAVSKGTQKLSQMRNTLHTGVVTNWSKSVYQSVSNRSASWTQSLKQTYHNILDSKVPKLLPQHQLVPLGPELAQRTVRETLQNAKSQTTNLIQQVTVAYNEKAKRWQASNGRFVPNPNVEKVEKPVRVERKVETVEERVVESKGTGNKTDKISEGVIRDGSHMRTDGALKPNVKYKAGEYEYLYETDNMGRLKEFNADDLKLTERDSRLPHKSNTPGKETGDHAGHLAGDRFGGSPDLDNLVSQSSNVNLSKYKKLENQWATAIKEGKKVSVNVKVNYDGTGLRPISFEIKYNIDGVIKKVRLKN
ncbi:transposase [Priestia megaterium]|nr:transposase [Priestia megaterium]